MAKWYGERLVNLRSAKTLGLDVLASLLAIRRRRLSQLSARKCCLVCRSKMRMKDFMLHRRQNPNHPKDYMLADV